MKSGKSIRKNAARPAAKPSRGLGDTIAKITQATYLDSLVQVYSDLTGSECRCEVRRRKLNKLVPYRKAG